MKPSPNQPSKRASNWEMLEQLIPVLQPLAKATEIMCAELHVGLSFIFPVIFNMISTTLRVEASDMTAVRAFKNTVRRQLEIRFKLESDDLTESIPTVACMLDPRFKHLHFIPEDKSEAAYSHLNSLVSDEGEPLAAKAHHVNSGGEPVTGKKARLEQDFEQLFGPHYHSGRKTAQSTAAEEISAYFSAPQIPTMENPLQWWALFPVWPSFAKDTWVFQLPVTPAREFFTGWEYHQPTAGKPPSSSR